MDPKNDLSELLQEMLAETGGPLTDVERAEADMILAGMRKPLGER